MRSEKENKYLEIKYLQITHFKATYMPATLQKLVRAFTIYILSNWCGLLQNSKNCYILLLMEFLYVLKKIKSNLLNKIMKIYFEWKLNILTHRMKEMFPTMQAAFLFLSRIEEKSNSCSSNWQEQA